VPGRARSGAYHHGDLPRALVQAAVQAVARQGPEALTLREVARAVGVSHTAAYRHFADRAALLQAVAEEGFDRLGARMSAALETARSKGAANGTGAGTREALLALGQAYLGFALSSPGHFRVMFAPQQDQATADSAAVQTAIQRTLEPLLTTLERGRAAGELGEGPTRDIGVCFWTLTHGYAVLVASRRLRARSAAAAADYYARVVLPPLLEGLLRSA
jgi:AcrR family transcriptional regulator